MRSKNPAAVGSYKGTNMIRSFSSKTQKPPGIEFPLLECWNPITKAASILALVDGKRILCKIPLDVLIKKFSASAEAPMQAVAEHRIALRAIAKTLIEKSAYDSDGSILISHKDV